MARPNNAAFIQIHLQGLREAKAAFQAVPLVVREALLVGTTDTVKAITDAAKTRVMASPSIRTRALLNNIAWTVNKKSGLGRAGVRNARTTVSNIATRQTVRVRGAIVSSVRNGRVQSIVVQPSRYAHLVEFGTRYMSAEPFMGPALEGQRHPGLERWKQARTAIENSSVFERLSRRVV